MFDRTEQLALSIGLFLVVILTAIVGIIYTGGI